MQTLAQHFQEWITERDRVTAEMEHHFQAILELQAAERTLDARRLQMIPPVPSTPLRASQEQIPQQSQPQYQLSELLRKAEAPEMVAGYRGPPQRPNGNGHGR